MRLTIQPGCCSCHWGVIIIPSIWQAELQVTPDGRLGLVANSVTNVQDGAAWKTVPDDKLFVIDLAASPPNLIDTLTVGKRPSGLSISRKGDLAFSGWD